MNKKGLLIISAIVIVIFIVFISGKKSTTSGTTFKPVYIAGQEVVHRVDEIYQAQYAEELSERFKRLNKRGVFNGTVLYGENDQIVFEGAYGYRDFKKRDTMTIQSKFQLASVSKMFTAAAIMVLKEEGKLEYDDTITRFIPEFPYGTVTIRHLLNHRSGLSRYMSLADKHWNISTPIDNEDVIDLFVKYKPAPYFKPDHGFHYCNTNYALLASVVERITGLYFDEFMKLRIFDPLGMDSSFVYHLRNDSLIGYSVPVGVPGYRYRGWRPVKVGDYYLNGVMGDKGVYSTVEDLFKFSCALDDGSLISLQELEEAFKPGSPDYYRRKDNYGFGWRLKDDMDSTAYHFGWWKGFRTYFVRDMRHQRTLIVLTNTHKGTSSSVFWDIIKDEDRTSKLMGIYQSLN
ncbi:MAG: beta-lactamase family protein [Bacteroidetes bacterium]|nr:beta-lactamase family protein [Bacteroidota bacterium]